MTQESGEGEGNDDGADGLDALGDAEVVSIVRYSDGEIVVNTDCDFDAAISLLRYAEHMLFRDAPLDDR